MINVPNLIKVRLLPPQGIKVNLKTTYLYDADWIPEINKAVEDAKESADNAKVSEQNAAQSASDADADATNAAESATIAYNSEQNAIAQANKATEEANAAAESADQAQTSALAAHEYASNAEADAQNALETLGHVLESETISTSAANTAKQKAQEASESAEEAQRIKDSLGNVYVFKGSVATFDDLPTVGNEIGDVYNILDTDKNYAWDGEKWDDIGGTVDLSDYALKTELPINSKTNTPLQSITADTTKVVIDGVNYTTYSVYQRMVSDDKEYPIGIKGVANTAASSSTMNFCADVTLNPSKGSIKCKELLVNDESVITDKQVYRSLSEEKKSILVNEGTYDGKEVSDGEVFTEYDGKFVAFSNTPAAGQAPSAITLPSSGPMYAHGSRVILFPYNGTRMHYSDDNGSSWTESQFANISSQSRWRFAHNGSRYLAVHDNGAYSSIDGITWVSCNRPNINVEHYSSFGGKFYAYYQNNYWYSEDGSSWTKGTSPVSGNIVLLCRDEDILLFGTDGKVYSSTDGVSWEAVGGATGISSLSYSTAKAYYVLGVTWIYNGYNTAKYSRDLETWTSSSSSAMVGLRSTCNVSPTLAISGDATNNSRNYIFTTTDGINWTQVALSASVSQSTVSATTDGHYFVSGYNSSTGFVGKAGTSYSITDLSYNKADVDSLINGQATAIAGKQDKLTAGENITIENNVISATGGSADITDKITNCITEIPQDIKLSLNNGTLTLLAGSKVYVPNGAGNFDVVNFASDKTVSQTTNGIYFIGIGNNAKNIAMRAAGKAVSGSTDSMAGTTYHWWYDTTNNVIKSYSSDTTTPSDTISLPVAVVTVSNGAISSIDQIFNGFGYISSTVFALPGVKGLIPNGRNEDGTLKNSAVSLTSVCTTSYTGTNTLYFGITSGNHLYYQTKSVVSYDETTNTTNWQTAIIAEAKVTSGVISDFKPKTTFHALDYYDAVKYSDKTEVVGWGMPDYSGAISIGGTSYTAPYNGFICFEMPAAPGHITGNIGGISFSFGADSGNYKEASSAIYPLKKGQVVSNLSILNANVWFVPCLGG